MGLSGAGGRRVVRLMLAAVAGAVALPGVAGLAAPSPSSLTVGVNGAGPSTATFSGGPITGTADGSGNAAPVACTPPACETITINLAAPPSLPPKEIKLAVTVTFNAAAGNPSGLSGIDTWLFDSSGNQVGSAVSGSSPAVVAASGVSAGKFTLEVTGEAAAAGETYTGVAAASIPVTTPAAPVGSLFATGILPPAPASGLTGTNEDAEPGIGVDGDGTFWVASDIEPFAASDPRALQALSGSDVWRSKDGGRTWAWVAAPFQGASASSTGLGGEDTDIAVAPEKNSAGFYNIYVASLWVGSTNVAVSQDGGATWSVTPVNGEPAQDRPWLSADGPCIFYLSYHALAPYDTVVDRYDTCNQAGQAIGSAVSPSETTLFAGNIAPGLSNRFGKQVVDNSPSSPYRHRIYVPMEGCAVPTQNGAPEAGVGCQTTPQEFVGYSDDGSNYTDSIVANVTTNKLFIWPDTVATDSAGGVYLAWFDGRNSYVARSENGGQTWGPSIRVNAAPALSTAYPTVAASSPGHVEVAFYGSTRPGDADDPTAMGAPNTFGSANWQLFWARSSDFGRTWTQSTVSHVLHTGVLCYNGSGCGQYTGDRNLLDDFGLAISPKSGTAAITFDNDQPAGLAGKTHTDFAAELAAAGGTTSTISTPNTASGRPAPGVLLALAALAVAAGLAWRRRRAIRADRM